QRAQALRPLPDHLRQLGLVWSDLSVSAGAAHRQCGAFRRLAGRFRCGLRGRDSPRCRILAGESLANRLLGLHFPDLRAVSKDVSMVQPECVIMGSMKLRILALACALSCAGLTMAQTAGQPPTVRKAKRFKKSKNFKGSKASKVKPRKAKKHRKV